MVAIPKLGGGIGGALRARRSIADRLPSWEGPSTGTDTEAGVGISSSCLLSGASNVVPEGRATCAGDDDDDGGGMAG